MVSFATTKDGRDPRRKALFFLIFGRQLADKLSPTAKFYLEARKYTRMRLSRNRQAVQIGALFKQPDGFWRVAHLVGTEKYNFRFIGQRRIWSYYPYFEWTTEAPMTPSLPLMKLWVRMNFDWFLFNKVYKPQLHRLGLMI